MRFTRSVQSKKLAALELDSDAITKAQAIVKAAKDLKL